MSKNAFAIAMGLVLAFTIGAYADDTKKSDDGSKSVQEGPLTTENLLNKLHTCNAKDIELAKLAIEKSDNEDVREYADMLARDHRQADEKVLNLAQAKNIKLKSPQAELARGPAATPGTSPEGQLAGAEQKQHKKEYARLQSLSGNEFNREYTMRVTESHRLLLDTLELAELEIDDAQVKALITELEPAVRKHEERAAALARQFGGDPSQIDRETTD